MHLDKPIHLIIPVKSSSRYPGKNAALYGFTLLWLYNELRNNPDLLYTLTIVGDPNEIPYIPADANIVKTNCSSLIEDLLIAASKYNQDDLFITLQLTLPLRLKGLLKLALEAYMTTNKPVISAIMQRDNNWRIVDAKGRWKGHCKDNDKKLPHYDGAIYVWQPHNLKDIFNKDAEHTVVIQDITYLIDIDYKEDIPSDLFNKINETSIINRQWK